MERASEELERRSRYLSSLIALQHQQKQLNRPEEEKRDQLHLHRAELRGGGDRRELPIPSRSKEKDSTLGIGKQKVASDDPMNAVFSNVRVRASEMPLEMQKRAFCCAHQELASMPKLQSKRLALALKKEFDSSYGPAWHCIVGTSFGSYVTYTLGGFLYFSIDKVYILLFRTAVEPLEQ